MFIIYIYKHYSNGMRNNVHSHCCGPVYGRISSRQSLGYHYDRSCFNGPINQNCSSHDYMDVQMPSTSSKHSKITSESFLQNQNEQIVHVPYRHSLFNPRSTIRFINGFKDWVSCWVLGTARRKKKQTYVLNGRKTVTSLIVSQSSMNRTGQRLSSFNNYSSVDYCSIKRNDQKMGKIISEKNKDQIKLPEKPLKKYKKRQAPLPPSKPVLNENTSNNIEAKFPLRSMQKSPKQYRKKRRAPPPPMAIKDTPNDQDDWVVISDSALAILNSIKDDLTYIDGVPDKKANSVRNSITISESDDDLPNGITRFGTSENRSFSHKGDTCLKISIEKREMNVLTVEEIRESSESSLSELSDSEDISPREEKSQILTTDKSSSSEETPQTIDAKPIFKELQLTPPPKACVKDFVNAFNMLADRGRYSDNKKNIENLSSQEVNSSTSKCIKSFPTKWEFQKNERSNSLHPIVEEEQSEAEVNDSEKIRSPNLKLRRFSEPAQNIQEKLVLPIKPNINASDIAVTSLLSKKSSFKGLALPKVNGVKVKKSKGQKFDQPIMVSLYIEDKSTHRGPMPLLVTPSMTLRKLKKQVEKEYNFDKDLQCWILGETFAIHDEASLASYGVVEAGFPILLYVMSMDSKSLPLKSKLKAKSARIYDDVASNSSSSETEDVLDREIGRSLRRSKNTKSDKSPKQPLKSKLKGKNEFHKILGKDFGKKKDENDYHALVELDNIDLVTNTETFECPICFLDVEEGQGAVLQECLHIFCKECLAAAIQYSETAIIKCPFRNDEYSCDSHLQEREIKSLVSPDVFDRYLQRSMVLAESQASDSFHCKTPDCPGWCLFEDNVNMFLCPVCKKKNCLTCAAIHEGRNCRQYQDDVASRCDSSEEAKKTKEYLENMVKDGDAMKCPKCEIILMKKWGCDWLKCSMCQTEVCWVTKGPRWGPEGRGDTSAGCKCMLNGTRCHPKCNYCH